VTGLLALSLAGSTDPVINIGGLPIPDAGPVFLAVLAVHVLAASVCVVAGAAAATARKRPGRHPRAGTVYVWGLLVVVVSAGVLAVIRWQQDRQLFFVAVAAAGFGFTGWWARRRRPRRWLVWHGGGMAGSYIVLLTGFYVDNGPHLPFWDRLPPALLWLLPTAIGVPITVRALIRNSAAGRVNSPRGAARSAAPHPPPRRAGPS
jgi:hypothetical protein